uniref:CUB domain-containing protein n=1 Tax=Panagrolaimus davidi TaxID=227884 RepID=A0A914Q8Z4_9BILA
MFKFEQTDYDPPQWTAFEGIVYAYTPKNRCPFSDQITNLESNRVIPVSSSNYMNSDNRNSNCNWTFTINSNQTLKIVFKYLHVYNNAKLKLETDGYVADM